MVYIREAHAVDGASPLAGGRGPVVEEPLHLGERRAVAEQCIAALDLRGLPALVDDVDDAVARAYGGWPDRLVLVDAAGTVAYQSMRGPAGFDPDELEVAIRAVLAPR